MYAHACIARARPESLAGASACSTDDLTDCAGGQPDEEPPVSHHARWTYDEQGRAPGQAALEQLLFPVTGDRNKQDGNV